MNIPHGLGDPNRTVVVYGCPHCGVLSQHNKTVVPGFADHRSIENTRGGQVVFHSQELHVILACSNCKRMAYLLYHPPFLNSANEHPTLKAKISHAYPVAMPALHEAIPKGIRDAAVEAEKCLGVGAHNACGVMTRRAMHALCEDKGATGKDLFAQLKDLKDRHLITPDLWEWSEELRILGRNGAHPEWPEVTPEDAEYGVKFLREIIRYLYINPHERNQRRLKETSSKS